MNIQEAKQIIQAADICGHVPLIKGLHGIGKSDAAKQYAAEQNMHFEPLILSLMDTGDMLGIPTSKTIGGMEATVWSAPSWYTNIVNYAWPSILPMERLEFRDKEFQSYVSTNYEGGHSIGRGKLNKLYCEYYHLPEDTLQLLRQANVQYLDSKRSVLFLDEFNRAPNDILNASLQLILDHRLHTHILPVVNGQETLVVAAVNPANGDYTVQEFDPALLDRFVSCEVTPDFKAWLKWAKASNVNSVVTDFLVDNQSKFHHTPADGSKGASPRSWTRLATFMDRIKDVPEEIMTDYCTGTIGAALSAQFLSFYNSYGKGLTVKSLVKSINAEIKKTKAAGVDVNPEALAEVFAEQIQEIEAIRRNEFAETLFKTYVEKETAEEAMPLLVYLYALPLESLGAVLKSLQSENIQWYANLAILDKEANGKKLFLKLTSKAKGI